MQTTNGNAAAAAAKRLEQLFSGSKCDWPRFYQPKNESMAFGSRYLLVYPALAYFVELSRDPNQADRIRPQLDTIFRGLIEERCWKYWHIENDIETWPLERANLTYAGRVATFVGLYINAFGEPPADSIEVDGRATTYKELSRNLHEQMSKSPSCGVSCFNNSSMVQCNAHLLINNVIHDRLYKTNYSDANANWLASVEKNLLCDEETGSIFFFGTQPNKPDANVDKRAIGTDIWALFLMSAIVPERVSEWFETWQRNVVSGEENTYVQVGPKDQEEESSTNELATAWAYCLAKELGQQERAEGLRQFLSPKVAKGFDVDPYVTGLFHMGEHLEKGVFRKLVQDTP